MTQDQWMKGFERLLTDYGDAREDRDAINSGKWMQAIRAHLQQRPMPVRGGMDEHQFYEQMRLTLIGQVHELIDIAERHAWTKDAEEKRRTEGAIAYARKVTAPYNYNGTRSPSLPVREEPTELPQLRNRGLLQAAKQAESALTRYIQSTEPRKHELLYEAQMCLRPAIKREEAFVTALASSPSVQNMGEGETGKDGVKEVPRADD